MKKKLKKVKKPRNLWLIKPIQKAHSTEKGKNGYNRNELKKNLLEL
jgi:hypothetical protein